MQAVILSQLHVICHGPKAKQLSKRALNYSLCVAVRYVKHICEISTEFATSGAEMSPNVEK